MIEVIPREEEEVSSYEKKYMNLEYNERISKKKLIEHLILEADLGDITCGQLRLIITEIIDFKSDERTLGKLSNEEVRVRINEAAQKAASYNKNKNK